VATMLGLVGQVLGAGWSLVQWVLKLAMLAAGGFAFWLTLEWVQRGWYGWAAFGLTIGVLLWGAVAAPFVARQKDAELAQALWARRYELADHSTILLDGARLDRHTELVRFRAALSFGFVTSEQASWWLLAGRDNVLAAGLFYTLLTLVVGWWAFPWGPIATVRAVYRNLRGGERITVGELLAELGA